MLSSSSLQTLHLVPLLEMKKMIPSTSFLILIHYVSDILGESRSFSNSRWDELSRGKTFVAPRLLPVTSLLFTPKGKRSLN